MIMLLYGLALRREEVVALDAENVDLQRAAEISYGGCWTRGYRSGPWSGRRL